MLNTLIALITLIAFIALTALISLIFLIAQIALVSLNYLEEEKGTQRLLVDIYFRSWLIMTRFL